MSISFEIALLQISHPWLDEAFLKLEGLYIPGLHARAWSIGELTKSNDGVMPLITNTIILAQKIEISSKMFSKEATDYMTETYW